MTNIHQLPEEILIMIFKTMPSQTLKEIQAVCRDWYCPAHLAYLTDVKLESSSQIERFIASIDNNPLPSYLNAVRIIRIENLHFFCSPFTKDSIAKLFFRFPNLEEVYIYNHAGLFYDFGIEVCNDFLNHCPKLNTFQVMTTKDDQQYYWRLLYKARQLVTSIDLDMIDELDHFESITQFLNSFPRLRNIVGGSEHLDNFQKLLPVFEQLPNLTSFTVGGGEDEERFEEKYLAQKPKQVQDLITKRLSKVKDLSWHWNDGFSPSSAHFAAKYFKNLNNLYITCFSNENWSVQQRISFCNDLLDLVCSVKNTMYVGFERMKLSTLSASFPTIIHKTLTRNELTRVQTVTKCLELAVVNRLEPSCSSLHMRFFHRLEGLIGISVSNKISLSEIVSGLFNEISTIGNLDKFILRMDDDSMAVNIGTYRELLQKMPSLKEIELDIPALCTDEKTITDSGEGHAFSLNMVEKLTLSILKNEVFENPLNNLNVVFPNLRHLNIHGSSAILDGESREFNIQLKNYSLESLVVDVALFPLEAKKKDIDYFVIEVNLLQDREKILFNVSNDLATVNKVSHDNLHAFPPGVEPVRVQISLKNLRRLQLCEFKGFAKIKSYTCIFEKDS